MGLARNLSKLKPSTSGLIEADDIANNTITAAKLAEGAALPSQTGNAGKLLSTDGSLASWTAPPSGGFNGANNPGPSSSDLVLTSSSAQTQLVTISDTTKSVTLPDATTLQTKGTPAFVIINTGVTVGVKDGAGNVLGVLNTGQILHISLIDNTTQAGIWKLSNNILLNAGATYNPASAFAQSNIQYTALNGDVITYNSCVMPNSSTIIFYDTNGGSRNIAGGVSHVSVYYRVATISNGILTFGTNSRYDFATRTVAAWDYTNTVAVVTVGNKIVFASNSARIAGSSSTYATYSRMVCATISGTSLSFGSQYTYSTEQSSGSLTNTTPMGQCLLGHGSATDQFVGIFNTQYGRGSQGKFKVFTLSGTTISEASSIDLPNASAMTNDLTYPFNATLAKTANNVYYVGYATLPSTTSDYKEGIRLSKVTLSGNTPTATALNNGNTLDSNVAADFPASPTSIEPQGLFITSNVVIYSKYHYYESLGGYRSKRYFYLLDDTTLTLVLGQPTSASTSPDIPTSPSNFLVFSDNTFKATTLPQSNYSNLLIKRIGTNLLSMTPPNTSLQNLLYISGYQLGQNLIHSSSVCRDTSTNIYYVYSTASSGY